MNSYNMKYSLPTILFFTVILSTSSFTHAQSADIYESFSGYTTGQLLTQAGTGTGTSGAWRNDDKPSAVATGLTYGSLLTTGGGSSTSPQGRGGILLDSSFRVDDTTTGDIYLSLLMQSPSGESADAYKAFELHDGGFNDDFNRKVQIGLNSSDFRGNGKFGARVATSSATENGALANVNADVNLIVAKFSLSATQDSDSATFWFNPEIGAAGDPDLSSGITLSGLDISYDRFTLANYGGSGNGILIDEIRFGSTYGSVTPVP
ncbi:MAG: hypothetical protein ACI81V_001376 [Lentimonas sp.]|jgi:hypothetical protein